MMLHSVSDTDVFCFDGFGADAGIGHFVARCDMSLRSDAGVENRRRVAQMFGFDIGRAVSMQQTHSDIVHIVGEADCGRGATDYATRIGPADALVTNLRGVCLIVLTADCVPVLLYDGRRRVVAAVHAGWRGTAQQIVVRTVEAMAGHFGSMPADIRAAIGVAIGKCCFEVGQEVVEAVGSQFVSGMSKPGRPLVDLRAANARQLECAGVPAENVIVSRLCTVCDGWPSWRGSGTQERIGSGIWLEE